MRCAPTRWGAAAGFLVCIVPCGLLLLWNAVLLDVRRSAPDAPFDTLPTVCRPNPTNVSLPSDNCVILSDAVVFGISGVPVPRHSASVEDIQAYYKQLLTVGFFSTSVRHTAAAAAAAAAAAHTPPPPRR